MSALSFCTRLNLVGTLMSLPQAVLLAVMMVLDLVTEHPLVVLLTFQGNACFNIYKHLKTKTASKDRFLENSRFYNSPTNLQQKLMKRTVSKPVTLDRGIRIVIGIYKTALFKLRATKMCLKWNFVFATMLHRPHYINCASL